MGIENRCPTNGYSYDAAGNVLNDGFHNYTYDAENRMLTVDGSAPYVYDANGRRVKTPGYEALYDLAGHMVTQLNPTSGMWNFGEIYAGGMHVATYSNGTTSFIHSDWLGTRRILTGMSGAVTQTCTNFPFGDGQSCTTGWSYDFFTDHPHDSESNLEHTWFRQLSTTQGRWLSPDPYDGSMDIGNPQSFNRYAYVGNDPMNATDPLGLRAAPCPVQTTGSVDREQIPCDPSLGWGTGGGGWGCDFAWCGSQGVLSGIIGDIFGSGQSGTTSGNGGSTGGESLGIPGSIPLPTGSLTDFLPELPKQCDFGPCDFMGSSSDPYARHMKRANNCMWIFCKVTDFYPVRYFGTHWCGYGGAGPAINQVDTACMAHDKCFDQIGLTAQVYMSGKLTPGQVKVARDCNQQICNAMSDALPPALDLTQWAAKTSIYHFYHIAGPAPCHY